jgi:hypothetical protein
MAVIRNFFGTHRVSLYWTLIDREYALLRPDGNFAHLWV